MFAQLHILELMPLFDKIFQREPKITNEALGVRSICVRCIFCSMIDFDWTRERVSEGGNAVKSECSELFMMRMRFSRF